jgi:hypothetical protein
MKKIVIILSGIIVVSFVLYKVCMKRTPETILKQQVDINLSGFDYTVESFQEQWYPNGDGYLLLVFNFDNLNKDNIVYLSKGQLLPVSETILRQIPPNKIPKRFLLCQNGYYLYYSEDEDVRNFKIYIFDIKNHKAILYYQIM